LRQAAQLQAENATVGTVIDNKRIAELPLDGRNDLQLTYLVLPSIGALQEFKVQIGVYPAEFGHNATQINVLTKSGATSITARCSSSCETRC
jgi:hypothetical protein